MDTGAYKRDSNVDSVEVVSLICVTSVVGAGTDSDPVRRIVEYWTMEGQLVVLLDPIKSV